MDHHDLLRINSVLGRIHFDNIGPALIILFALLVILAFGISFFSSPSSRTREAPPDLERQPLLPSE